MSRLVLVIGNKNYSSWSLRPWIFMKHNNIGFEERKVLLFTETMETELAEYGSDSKVPVLKDGDLVVWDTLSILEYLSENFMDGKGWPEDRCARAIARSMSAEMHSSFSHVRNELPMNCRKQFHNIKLSVAAQHEVARIVSLWEQCRHRYGQGGEWLFGTYSIADAMFAPVALRFYGYNIPLQGIAADYVKSVLNHPGIIEWIEAGKQEKEIIPEDEIDM